MRRRGCGGRRERERRRGEGGGGRGEEGGRGGGEKAEAGGREARAAVTASEAWRRCIVGWVGGNWWEQLLDEALLRGVGGESDADVGSLTSLPAVAGVGGSGRDGLLGSGGDERRRRDVGERRR